MVLIIKLLSLSNNKTFRIMEAIYKRIKVTFCTLGICLSMQLSAQYSWTQKADFPGAIRTYAAGFAIGHYGFIGCGSSSPSAVTSYNDFWKWNQTTNTWDSIAHYPGIGYKLTPVSFTIEGKGYVGLGWTGSAGATDLWRYDTATNTWTAMAAFPGTGRYDEAVFVIGHKAYVVSGSSGGPPYLGDVWMYDAHANSWTHKNNSPAGQTDGGAAFAIGNHGYYGGGKDASVGYNTFWEYDTTIDTWTSIAPFPTATAPAGNSRAFVIGSKGYVCTGTKGNSYTDDLSVGYAYDTNTRAWTSFTNMGVNGIERSFSVAFTIGKSGYIGTGEDSTGNMLNTFWQYGDTSTAGINEINLSVNFNLFPNPSNGMMSLIYNGTQKGELEITDLTGRVLNSYEIKGSKGQMALNETVLSNGIYFYQVIDSGDLISSGKFIISK